MHLNACQFIRALTSDLHLANAGSWRTERASLAQLKLVLTTNDPRRHVVRVRIYNSAADIKAIGRSAVTHCIAAFSMQALCSHITVITVHLTIASIMP